MVAERYYTIREIVYGMATGGGSTAAGSSGSYSGKAHELIPEFSGKAVDYKEYRKRLLLYAKKMELANRQTETAFNVLSSLKGRAWDACEDITMEKLESYCPDWTRCSSTTRSQSFRRTLSTSS